MSGINGGREKREELQRGTRKLLEVMEMFTILIVVRVSCR